MQKCENCTKVKHRTEDEKKKLKRRLKIIAGQINGIEQMIDNDRYCSDVLLQISSASNALKSFGNEMLKSHLQTCVVEDINNGNLEVIDDVMDLFGKLNK